MGLAVSTPKRLLIRSTTLSTCGFDLTIVLDLRAAGHGDLHEAEASLILRIFLQEPFDGLETGWTIPLV